jgi:predicted lysophospholipase L1 biosynthesis ABC-type transport system permease subunit
VTVVSGGDELVLLDRFDEVQAGKRIVSSSSYALPALLRLIRVSPLRVLRRDLPPLPLAAWISILLSGSTLLALTVWYAGDAKLVALFTGALLALALQWLEVDRAGAVRAQPRSW